MSPSRVQENDKHMKKSGIKTLYVLISDSKISIIRYLTTVEKLTGTNSNTIAKHFLRHNDKPFEANGWILYKTMDVHLKSFNRGNRDNFFQQTQ